jgi:uncharacterized protein YecT (DUF1311 family)
MSPLLALSGYWRFDGPPKYSTIKSKSLPGKVAFSKFLRLVMSRVAVVLCLVALTPVFAKAEEQTSKAYAACLDKSGGVTVAMQACIADEFERQDKRLNAAYKALIEVVSEKRKTELRDVQRKWIAFLDANCSFYVDPEGGTADRLAANECRVTHTALRATELQSLKKPQ